MSGTRGSFSLACWWMLASLMTLPLEGASPEKTATCELKIQGHSITKLALRGKGAPDRHLLRPGQSVLLPAGQYRVEQVHLEGGYQADLRLNQEETWFELAHDRPHELVVGAPLSPKVNVTRQGTFLHLNYDVVDAAGRSYSKRDRIGAPQFAVYKGNRRIGSGSFRYG